MGAVLVLALLIRFLDLGTKSYWEDEGLTVQLLHQGFGAMLHGVRVGQPDPPFYFALAWIWARLFGFGEVALRSLSALAGLLTIPVAYAVARRLISRRAAAITAALLAVNPFLVWYSQEARGYALFALLATISLWCFVRALDKPSPRWLASWAGVCAAMLATHYFGVFLIVGEAVWLGWSTYSRRQVRSLFAIEGLALAAIVLTLVQSHSHAAASADWGGLATLPRRVVTLPGMFLIGFETDEVWLFGLLMAGLVLIALVLLFRHGAARQRGVVICGTLGLGGIAMAIGAAFVGADFLVPRNLIFTLVPLWIVIAAGLASAWDGRVARFAALGIGVIGCAIVLSTASTPKYHYQDWRHVAADMGTASGMRLIVVAPHLGVDALSVYLHRPLLWIDPSRVAVAEIDVIATRLRSTAQLDDPPAPRPLPDTTRLPAFKLKALYRQHSFTLLRYVSSHEVRVTSAVLRLARFAGYPAEAYLEIP